MNINKKIEANRYELAPAHAGELTGVPAGSGVYTYIELNKSAFEHNAANYKSIIGAGQLAIVVKSNAYGHGMFPIAELCQASPNVDWLCVANLSDALALHEHGIIKPILVMSCIDRDPAQAINTKIAFVVPDMRTAEQLNAIAEKYERTHGSSAFLLRSASFGGQAPRTGLGWQFPIHIKIDTGLRRFGFEAENVIEIIEQIIAMPYLKTQGIMTHFAQSQKPDLSFTHMQLEKYYRILDALEQRAIQIPLKHVANSAATLRLDLPRCNFFRVGIGIYGWWPSQALREEVEKKHPEFSFKPVLTWKTRITHIKTIPAGQPVGYDCTVTTARETRVAFIPVGYFDGFDFRLSNTGHAQINGIAVPILGRVSMNVATLDITDHPTIAIGDEVIILGPQEKVTAYDWVQNTGNPNIRELITTIHPSITRIIVENQLDNVKNSGILAQKPLEQKTDILA